MNIGLAFVRLYMDMWTCNVKLPGPINKLNDPCQSIPPRCLAAECFNPWEIKQLMQEEFYFLLKTFTWLTFFAMSVIQSDTVPRCIENFCFSVFFFSLLMPIAIFTFLSTGTYVLQCTSKKLIPSVKHGILYKKLFDLMIFDLMI